MEDKSKSLLNSKIEGGSGMKNKSKNLSNLKNKESLQIKFRSKKGFGINEIIGIAAGVIIAAVVVIPGLRSFAQTMMSELTTWWEGMSAVLFS